MKLIFDTETTGVIAYSKPIGDPVQPHIVQLGAQLTNDEGLVKGEINLLVKPDGWTIPAEAQAVHGISTEDCEKFGVPIRSALGMFNLWLQMNPLLVAHNIDFDTFLVETEANRLGKPPILSSLEKYCTMKNATDLVKIPNAKRGGYKWPKLQETHKFLFGEEFVGAHDAMADVRACGKCYFALAGYSTSHNDK